MVDWSARNVPATGRDTVWIAAVDAGDGPAAPPRLLVNPPTRAAAMALITELIESAHDGDERILIGFDFPFAYPAGLVECCPGLFGDGPVWEATWRTIAGLVEDGADNTNNRFAVAASVNRALGSHVFWGCPEREASPWLQPTAPRHDPGSARLADLREAERQVRSIGLAIQSAWKCYYPASVGGQAILGIARLHQLRRDVPGVRIWPFENGAGASGADRAVVAEIWPTLHDRHPDPGLHECKDARQVIATARTFARADETGLLSSWLEAPGSTGASAQGEGWVLGVGGADWAARVDARVSARPARRGSPR